MPNTNDKKILPINKNEMPTSRHFLMVTEGLPGPGYHGGAVSCWAVLKSMIARGHTATVIGLMSKKNPYNDFREEQLEYLSELGVSTKLIDLDAGQEKMPKAPPVSKLWISRYLQLLDFRNYDAIRKFDSKAKETVEGNSADGIFCYHFETVYALGEGELDAPITVCAVDLFHLPSYFRWKEQPFSFRKYSKDAIIQLAISIAMKRLMINLFRRCYVKIEFAPHYAKWFREQAGCEDTLYVQTPVHDPMGVDWQKIRNNRRADVGTGLPKILMIGDIGGTATTSGLRLCRDDVFPLLERELGIDSFEVHLVGGGTLAEEFKSFESKPYIKLRGRIMPPDDEFLSSDVVLVPTPHTLGVRVRIINAFSYGCCVVSHIGNQAGIPEMENGVNSLIARNGRELAEAILHVVKNPGLSEKVGNKARATFEAQFSDNVAGTRVVKLMEQAADIKSPSVNELELI